MWTTFADFVRSEAPAVGGPPLPPWPRHCYELLPRLTRLQEKFADGLQISVWSDCGGICAELFALKEIGQMLKTEYGFNMTVLPYAYCDSDVQARQFTELNHQKSLPRGRLPWRILSLGHLSQTACMGSEISDRCEAW